MARSAILPIKRNNLDVGIFSNKSSLILFWLMARYGDLKETGFSINEVSREGNVSVGLGHKVIKQLEYTGIVSAEGFRTSKKFYLKRPEKLLLAWVQEYNLVRRTSSRGFAAVDSPDFSFEKYGLVPALHTASEQVFRTKITNLKRKEFYLMDWENLPKVASQLHLQELDRGYEVLLIKPYYSGLLGKYKSDEASLVWKKAFLLLTILDLCHFPVRGAEQAEALFRKSEFKSICSWSEIERAIR